jgi:hypothetical protein
LELLKGLQSSTDQDLYQTMEDIKAISYLGKYYAHKILAATNLQFYKNNADRSFHQTTIDQLNLSSSYWRYYASTALAHYKNPLWTNRVGHVDWRDLYRLTLEDITHQGGQINLPSMEATPGGEIVEAESSLSKNLKTGSIVKGFTGTGYAYSSSEDQLQLTYQVPHAGKYVLEFRYLKNDFTTDHIMVEINRKTAYDFSFWPSGSNQNWVWDRLEVELDKGQQQISFSLPNGVLLDHVNVLAL